MRLEIERNWEIEIEIRIREIENCEVYVLEHT